MSAKSSFEILIVAFIMVNASVIAYWVRERRAGRSHNAVVYVAAPIIGIIVIAYLLTQLDIHAITLGSIWLVVGIGVLAISTRGFTRQPPEIPVDSE